MTRIRSGMREPFTAVGAFERFFSTMDANVFLEMMFKFERFFALWTFELAQHCAFIVTYHVPLEAVNVGERLVAHLTRHLGVG